MGRHPATAGVCAQAHRRRLSEAHHQGSGQRLAADVPKDAPTFNASSAARQPARPIAHQSVGSSCHQGRPSRRHQIHRPAGKTTDRHSESYTWSGRHLLGHREQIHPVPDDEAIIPPRLRPGIRAFSRQVDTRVLAQRPLHSPQTDSAHAARRQRHPKLIPPQPRPATSSPTDAGNATSTSQ